MQSSAPDSAVKNTSGDRHTVSAAKATTADANSPQTLAAMVNDSLMELCPRRELLRMLELFISMFSFGFTLQSYVAVRPKINPPMLIKHNAQLFKKFFITLH